MDNSFVQIFNQMKIINCMCPKCETIMRVSELQLRSKEKTEKTWLDTFEAQQKKLDAQEEKFDEEEQSIREKAVQHGRLQVPKLVNKSLNKEFAKLKYDPYDVKAILHPIDFVAFNGMNKGQVEDVTLLSSKTATPHMQSLHSAIAEAVKNKSYDWKVLRVLQDGEVEYK